jgi:hypothetical protein
MNIKISYFLLKITRKQTGKLKRKSIKLFQYSSNVRFTNRLFKLIADHDFPNGSVRRNLSIKRIRFEKGFLTEQIRILFLTNFKRCYSMAFKMFSYNMNWRTDIINTVYASIFLK